MKRGSILFLRGLIVLFGGAVLAWMLWEPHLEGRNVNADFWQIYFGDPFLAYLYLGSLPFFFGLYQGFKLLGFVDQGDAFSGAAVRAVGYIKYCALAVIGVIVGAELIIIVGHAIIEGADDDPAGFVTLGVLGSFVCLVTAVAAAVLERLLRNGVDLQSEHDLTV